MKRATVPLLSLDNSLDVVRAGGRRLHGDKQPSVVPTHRLGEGAGGRGFGLPRELCAFAPELLPTAALLGTATHLCLHTHTYAHTHLLSPILALERAPHRGLL